MVTISEALKKKAKKIWVPIIAPDEFRSREIGETYVYLPEQLLNRIITVNLAGLIDDPKKQNMNVMFKINEIKENKGQTEIVGYTLSSSYQKRLNRMTKARIEQSIPIKTKDNIEVQIKAIALTKFETNRSVLTAVRAKIKEFLLNNVQSLNYKELMNSVISFEFQKNLHKELKLIYPLSYVLVKTVKRLK